MSLFDFEIPHVQGVVFDPAKQVSGIGSNAPSNGVPVGTVWNDVSGGGLQLIPSYSITGAGIVSSPAPNITAVTATNPSAEANLMTLPTFPAGSINLIGKTLYFWAQGKYTTAGAQTPTLRIRAYYGSVAILDFTSAATTASVTKTWNVEGFIVTSATGASGTVQASGIFNVELGAGAAGSVAETSYNDAITAASSAIDLTAAEQFKLTALFSSSNAGNSVVQQLLVAEVAN